MECPVEGCGKVYSDDKFMSKHMETVHPEYEKPEVEEKMLGMKKKIVLEGKREPSTVWRAYFLKKSWLPTLHIS